MKSGNLNFLEPSVQLQACNRTALHLTYDTVQYNFNLAFFFFKIHNAIFHENA